MNCYEQEITACGINSQQSSIIAVLFGVRKTAYYSCGLEQVVSLYSSNSVHDVIVPVSVPRKLAIRTPNCQWLAKGFNRVANIAVLAIFLLPFSGITNDTAILLRYSVESRYCNRF